MRKEIVEHRTTAGRRLGKAEWLDLDSIVHVQLTSEDPAFPIENALGTSPERNERGWRATSPGPQTITLGFDGPEDIRRIFLAITYLAHLTLHCERLAGGVNCRGC